MLNSVKGPTSFDDLKFGHGTYEEACIALGFVGSDEEYIKCVKTLGRTPHGLRLIVNILLLSLSILDTSGFIGSDVS